VSGGRGGIILAHSELDVVRAAYNYLEHVPERGKMMQF
jgi:hypothetical protein